MADGDPMRFRTMYDAILSDSVRDQGVSHRSLFENGQIEQWSEYATIKYPDGWSAMGAGYTHTRESGTRSSGRGSYYYRATIGSTGTGYQGDFKQTVVLRGNDMLPAYGHLGQTVDASIWARNTGSADMKLRVDMTEFDRAGGGSTATTDSSSFLSLSGVWTLYAHSTTITNDDTGALQVEFRVEADVTGNADVQFDDALCYFDYTFASPPSMPDDQSLRYPTRKIIRTMTGAGLRTRNRDDRASHTKRLRFGLVTLDQVKAFRSFYLADTPILWTPNQPHLPETLEVLWANDFDFRLKRGAAWGTNAYEGTIVLTELGGNRLV